MRLMNARRQPLGAKAGDSSHASKGGAVSLLLSSVSTESDQILHGSFGDFLSTNAMFFPSGDQLSGPDPTSVSFLSPPPNGLMMYSILRSPEDRRKAIWRLSGDHAGQQSSAESVVR